jgi:FKBP-type peptidyl-prolyl cis-trans isomerase
MKTYILIFAVLFSAAHLRAEEPPALKTEKDKVNYGIGVGVARNFQHQMIETTIDLNLVSRGMKDVLSGTKLLMTEEELQKTMSAFQTEVQQKLQVAGKVASEKNKKAGDTFLAENSKKSGVVTLASGLQYKILKTGSGKKPTAQDSVVCHYRGTFIDGAEFDSSRKRGEPVTLKVQGGVIAGWSEALKLMPVGSTWQIFIPPQLGYGERGAGNQIGSNETLIFEVELLGIK